MLMINRGNHIQKHRCAMKVKIRFIMEGCVKKLFNNYDPQIKLAVTKHFHINNHEL